MRKILLSAVALFCLTNVSKAQFDIENLSVGVGLQPVYYIALGQSTLINPLVKIQYELDDETSFGYLDFSIPTLSSEGKDDLGVDFTEKTTYINFNAGYGRYFVGEPDDDFNFYGKLGGGLSTFSSTYTKAGVSDELADGGWTINLGLGASLGINNQIRVFVEPNWVFASGTYNSQTGSTATYGLGNVNANVGLKYRFN